jgi:hypothetical protein
MALTQDEIQAIGKATAEHLISSLPREIDNQIGRRFKTKFELMFGANCEDEEERAEMRKDHETLRKARLYYESEEGQAAIMSFKKFSDVANVAMSKFVTFLIWAFMSGALILAGVGISHIDTKKWLN